MKSPEQKNKYDTKRHITRFDKNHQMILERYAEDLPLPNDNLQAVSVICASHEFFNGNFEEMLKRFISQKIPDNGMHEILYIINNSTESAYANDEIFKENQLTLKVLHILQEAKQLNKTHSIISQNEIPTAKKINTMKSFIKQRLIEEQIDIYINDNLLNRLTVSALSNLAFYGIDASTKEKSYPKSINLRAIARDIGGHIAYERLKTVNASKKTSGVISFLDADSFPLTDLYIKSLLETNAEKENDLWRKILLPRISPPEHISLPTTPTEKDYKKVITLITNYVIYYFLEITHHNYTTFSHGPSPIIRPELYRITGGYNYNTKNEDYEFARRLNQNINTPGKTLSDITGHKKDALIDLKYRVREGSVDGDPSMLNSISLANINAMPSILASESNNVTRALIDFLKNGYNTLPDTKKEEFKNLLFENWHYFELSRAIARLQIQKFVSFISHNKESDPYKLIKSFFEKDDKQNPRRMSDDSYKKEINTKYGFLLGIVGIYKILSPDFLDELNLESTGNSADDTMLVIKTFLPQLYLKTPKEIKDKINTPDKLINYLNSLDPNKSIPFSVFDIMAIKRTANSLGIFV